MWRTKPQPHGRTLLRKKHTCLIIMERLSISRCAVFSCRLIYTCVQYWVPCWYLGSTVRNLNLWVLSNQGATFWRLWVFLCSIPHDIGTPPPSTNFTVHFILMFWLKRVIFVTVIHKLLRQFMLTDQRKCANSTSTINALVNYPYKRHCKTR